MAWRKRSASASDGRKAAACQRQAPTAWRGRREITTSSAAIRDSGRWEPVASTVSVSRNSKSGADSGSTPLTSSTMSTQQSAAQWLSFVENDAARLWFRVHSISRAGRSPSTPIPPFASVLQFSTRIVYQTYQIFVKLLSANRPIFP